MLKPWFQRQFGNNPDLILPPIIERLAGTPIRLGHKMVQIEPAIFVLKENNKWSIQEHVGHLADIEPLWIGRIDDILNDKTEFLRSWDLENKNVIASAYNDQYMTDIIESFHDQRDQLITKLKTLTVEDLKKTALHPRLKTPMTVVELAFFVAEHDDHHLATITILDQSPT